MMEAYDSNGIEDAQIKEILKCEMAEEDSTNLEGLVASYHNLEKALFGENVQADEDDRDENGKIDVEEENLADLQNEDNNKLRNYLYNKLLIFQCEDKDATQAFIKQFRFIAEHGDNWVEEQS